MANGNEGISKITGAVEDAVTYPILTKEVDGYQGGGRNGESISILGANSPTRVAQETIRQVLGWRYRGQDTKGFVAALNRAFDLKEVEGHTEWGWKPQNYMVQADLGEITGAQASILTRARVAVEHALPLLEGLKPLREDADEDEMEAVRSIIRNALNELLREFGAARGPRVQRVDGYFEQMLGSNPDPGSPETVLGYFGILRKRFGLERLRVNTIVEEQNLTNSLILVDYVISLKQTWDANRKYFDRLRSAEPFLGTQLVLLSQALETIAESVHETYDAMDSVFFSAIERQTTDITFDNNGIQFKVNGDNSADLFEENPSPMTIAELLGWIEDFVTSEARQLIQDAGKDGVVGIRKTLLQLGKLVTAARMTSELDSSNPGRGFHSGRVRRALSELETQLRKAYELTIDVRPAEIERIEPSIILANFDNCDSKAIDREITLFGDGLSDEGDVYLSKDASSIQATDVQLFDGALIASFELGHTENLSTGEWIVQYKSQEGVSIDSPNKIFLNVPPPSITEVNVQDGEFTIKGKNFRPDAKVMIWKTPENPSSSMTFGIRNQQTQSSVNSKLSKIINIIKERTPAYAASLSIPYEVKKPINQNNCNIKIEIDEGLKLFISDASKVDIFVINPDLKMSNKEFIFP